MDSLYDSRAFVIQIIPRLCPRPVTPGKRGAQTMQRVDELLALFLDATDEGEVSRLLDQLVAEHIRPLLNQIISLRE